MWPRREGVWPAVDHRGVCAGVRFEVWRTHLTGFELVTCPSAGSSPQQHGSPRPKRLVSPIIRQYSGFTPKAPAASQTRNREIVNEDALSNCLSLLLILPAETPADVVTFPGAEAEGYSFVSEVKETDSY